MSRPTHGQSQNPVHGSDIINGNRHAVLGQVVTDDGHELQTETEGDGDVGGLVAEGQTAGGRPAVQLHLIHHGQHGRNQNGDVGDVHGNQVLGQAGHSGQDEQQHGAALAADGLGQLLGGHVRQTGGGNRRGEGAQQHIGQGCGGVDAEAGGQRSHGLLNGHAAQQTAHQGGNDQGHEHVQLKETQDTQDDDCYGYWVG